MSQQQLHIGDCPPNHGGKRHKKTVLVFKMGSDSFDITLMTCVMMTVNSKLLQPMAIHIWVAILSKFWMAMTISKFVLTFQYCQQFIYFNEKFDKLQ